MSAIPTFGPTKAPTLNGNDVEGVDPIILIFIVITCTVCVIVAVYLGLNNKDTIINSFSHKYKSETKDDHQINDETPSMYSGVYNIRDKIPKNTNDVVIKNEEKKENNINKDNKKLNINGNIKLNALNELKTNNDNNLDGLRTKDGEITPSIKLKNKFNRSSNPKIINVNTDKIGEITPATWNIKTPSLQTQIHTQLKLNNINNNDRYNGVILKIDNSMLSENYEN